MAETAKVGLHDAVAFSYAAKQRKRRVKPKAKH